MADERAPQISQTDAELGDVPPAIRCAICQLSECAGCSERLGARPSLPVVPWEAREGSWFERLWRTAISSSVQPAETFGRLPAGGVLPALGFALLAELVAIGSFALLLLAGAWATAPGFWSRVLGAPELATVALGLVVSCSVVMVALHALWGLCVELGALSGGSAFLWRQGLRFGLYACGWDLLTSPAGVIQGLMTRGWNGGWAPIVAAVRVPRIALRAYVDEHRHLSRTASRLGMRLSVLLVGGALVSFVFVAVVLLVRASRWYT